MLENCLLKRDLEHIWHPCMPMKYFEHFPPLLVHKARGSYLYTDKGPIIDAISSWWCKSLGHNHPTVIKAIRQQLTRFEHIIGATTTHETWIELGELLAQITGKQYSFYASDGSSAVEIALKLSLHSQQIKGQVNRKDFVALSNGYHGETLATLSVSDVGLYKKPYKNQEINCHFIHSIPYVTGQLNDLKVEPQEKWSAIFSYLDSIKETIAAIVVEPLVQGAGGMQMYHPGFLKKLAEFARKNCIYFIADEIMTGLGRCGAWLACDITGVKPDMLCLSKGLTSGSIPFSVVMLDKEIYDLFYHQKLVHNFLHSHTFSGNALGASAALATLKTMQALDINQKSQNLGNYMYQHLQAIARLSSKLNNVRQLGAIVAAELIDYSSSKHLGWDLYRVGIEQGIFLRPLNQTIYWLPPLTTDFKTIDILAEKTLHSINTLYT